MIGVAVVLIISATFVGLAAFGLAVLADWWYFKREGP